MKNKIGYYYRLLRVAAAAVAFGPAAFAADGPLSRSGKASFISSWTATATERHDLGAGYVVDAGVYWGTSTNNAGKGFLHKAAWKCVGSVIGFNNKSVQREYCVVTDPDGDKLYGPADATVSPETGLVGNVVYEHGTGKYAGIKGGHNFVCRRVGTDKQAFCESEANWRFD